MTVSTSPMIRPFCSISFSGTLGEPVLVTMNVVGPAGTLRVCGPQPASLIETLTWRTVGGVGLGWPLAPGLVAGPPVAPGGAVVAGAAEHPARIPATPNRTAALVRAAA